MRNLLAGHSVLDAVDQQQLSPVVHHQQPSSSTHSPHEQQHHNDAYVEEFMDLTDAEVAAVFARTFKSQR